MLRLDLKKENNTRKIKKVGDKYVLRDETYQEYELSRDDVLSLQEGSDKYLENLENKKTELEKEIKKMQDKKVEVDKVASKIIKENEEHKKKVLEEAEKEQI